MEIDVSTLGSDLASIEALARIRLRLRAARFRGASQELCDLAAFCGLASALGLEPQREPEERKQRLGVEEEGELGDAIR